jgi:hypothetical protein
MNTSRAFKRAVAVVAVQAERALRIEQNAQFVDDGGLDRGAGAGRAQRAVLLSQREDDHGRGRRMGIAQQTQIRAAAAHGLVVGDAAFAAEEFRALVEDQVGGLDDSSARSEVAIENQAAAARGLQGLARPR